MHKRNQSTQARPSSRSRWPRAVDQSAELRPTTHHAMQGFFSTTERLVGNTTPRTSAVPMPMAAQAAQTRRAARKLRRNVNCRALSSPATSIPCCARAASMRAAVAPPPLAKMVPTSARSCTRTLRINIPGSPVDRHYGKTAQTRGPSYHHGGPLNRVDALEADPANARRLLRPPHI